MYLFIDDLDDLIKAHNNFSRKVNKLIVHLHVILFEMRGGNLKDILVNQIHINLIKFGKIDLLTAFLSNDFKLLNKLFKTPIDLFGANISAIDNINLFRDY